MTHLDCDHVSGLRDFPGVVAYVSAEELAYTRRSRIRYGGLAKGHDYEPIPFAGDGGAPFGVSADVLGDGSVTAYLTPTHSAGSVIYRVRDDEGFALLVGDNGYSEDSWERGLLPGPLYDANNMRRCLAWIRSLAADEGCVGVYCAHDPVDRGWGTVATDPVPGDVSPDA